MATALLGNHNETAQSLFKYELLSRYLLTFISTTAPDGRVTVVDGAAGSGRHKDGTPASAERILRFLRRQPCDIDAYFIERNPSRYRDLSEMVAGYEGVALPGPPEDHLDTIAALPSPLFLFLEPYGAGFEHLQQVLASSRGGPATEALIDFSPALPRQVSAALRSESRAEAMDRACGGGWWRHIAETGASPTRRGADPVGMALASEYARRLSDRTGMSAAVLPVHRRLSHRPIQYLIFLTRSDHGLWVFAHTAARTRQAWQRRLGELADQRDGLKLISDSVLKDDVIRREETASRAIITDNIRSLLASTPRFKLAQETVAVLGSAYGVATEGVIREVVTGLQAAGELNIGQNNKPPAARTRTRDLMIFRPG